MLLWTPYRVPFYMYFKIKNLHYSSTEIHFTINAKLLLHLEAALVVPKTKGLSFVCYLWYSL